MLLGVKLTLVLIAGAGIVLEVATRAGVARLPAEIEGLRTAELTLMDAGLTVEPVCKTGAGTEELVATVTAEISTFPEEEMDGAGIVEEVITELGVTVAPALTDGAGTALVVSTELDRTSAAPDTEGVGIWEAV